MKITTTEEYLVTRERVTSVVCDKCLKPFKLEDFKRHALTISYEGGYMYPEGGSGPVLEIEDLCPACTVELFETLKKLGYRVKESEWDY